VAARAPRTIAEGGFSMFLPADGFYLPTGSTAGEGGVPPALGTLVWQTGIPLPSVIMARVHLSLQQECQNLLFQGICDGWKRGSVTTFYS